MSWDESSDYIYISPLYCIMYNMKHIGVIFFYVEKAVLPAADLISVASTHIAVSISFTEWKLPFSKLFDIFVVIP